MHFVSENAGKKVIRHQKPVFSQASGEKIKTLPTIWLTLERGTAPDWAVVEAVKHFKFAHRPAPGSIGGADIPVERWCVYIDTIAWAEQNGHDESIRELADAILGSSSEMLAVEPPAVRPPWPNYDDLTIVGSRTGGKVAARNLETAEMTGVSIDELVSYEEATTNRESVLVVYRAAWDELQAELDLPQSIVIEA